MSNRSILRCVLTVSVSIVLLMCYAVTLGLFPTMYASGLKRLRSGIDCMQRIIR